MERICAQTFAWGDYVPEAWDAWLADEHGLLIVGEADGRVVALSRIQNQPEGQVWLEGMRVDPDWRGRGIAGRFLDHSIAHASDRGARVVRLGTADHNHAVHKLAERSGMELVGKYLLRTAEPLPAAPEAELLGPRHGRRVQALLDASDVMTHCRNLCSAEWVWEELSAGRVATFLDHSQMVAATASSGELTALATVHPDSEDRVLWVGFADASPLGDTRQRSNAATELGKAIRRLAAEMDMLSVGFMVPDVSWLRDSFQAAGFGCGDWDGELWIYERKLAGVRRPSEFR